MSKRLKKREKKPMRRSLGDWTSGGSEDNRAKIRNKNEAANKEPEEYEDSETDDKADLGNDEREEVTSVLSSQNEERNSNETESINHIDNDLDDLEEMNTSNDNPEPEYDAGGVEEGEREENENSLTDEQDEEEAMMSADEEEVNERVNVEPIKPKPNNNSTAMNNHVKEEEELYCTCRDISYGNMIFCESSSCVIQWFHFKCVNLTTTPKGRWYCPQCRGDSHKVLKKVPASPHHHHHHHHHHRSAKNS